VRAENLSGESDKAAQAKPENGSGGTQNPTQVNTMVSKTGSEKIAAAAVPLPSPPLETETERGKRRGRGRGNSPETQNGSQVRNHPSPSTTSDQPEILRKLTKCFKFEWGRVPAREPDKIIPRELGGREKAQLRDLAKELSAVGGVPLDFIKQAFRDAAGRPDKMHISYVRRILLDWLGVARGPPA